MTRKRREKKQQNNSTIDLPSPEQVILLANESSKKKWDNWWIRTLWTFVMISGFLGVLMAGHIWIIFVVIIMQSIVYREVISIGVVPIKALKVPWFRLLHWYFYAVTLYFLYIESLIYYCKPIPFVERFLMPFATHHRFFSFLFYMIGFVSFVLSLRKGHYRFQFYQ
jgi:phosphatidate cytidylyltransferase